MGGDQKSISPKRPFFFLQVTLSYLEFQLQNVKIQFLSLYEQLFTSFFCQHSRVDREKRDKRKLFEEEDKEHQHLPLLVVQLPQGTAFLLSSRLDSAVKLCSSEVLVSS